LEGDGLVGDDPDRGGGVKRELIGLVFVYQIFVLFDVFDVIFSVVLDLSP
jgi:hypothetical protein